MNDLEKILGVYNGFLAASQPNNEHLELIEKLKIIQNNYLYDEAIGYYIPKSVIDDFIVENEK